MPRSIRVIVRSEDGSGSFICSDVDPSQDEQLRHFNQIGTTNYSNSWSGGMVFCPISINRTMRWMTAANRQVPAPSVGSIASLVGYF